MRGEVPDNHQLGIDELLDVLADLIGHVLDDLGQLILDAFEHHFPQGRRQVVPQLRVLTLHDLGDDAANF
ncbi:Uncharacterised protein [Mycobacteroides abscessus subsp. abscessus]|nr:Uncharacterised protein [Mycobacteroides abscessus subsp. abscessus]